MAFQRLDKLVASAARCSRREAKALIQAGRVLVDGTAVRVPEAKAESDTARVTLDGEILRLSPFLWVMLNKPAGYLTATEDPRAPTVMDLLPPDLHRLFPVGRLDKDTEGLLLLTNDGQTAHGLLSPRRGVEKEYFARVGGRLTEEDRTAFREGVILPDGLRCLPAGLEILTAEAGESTCHVVVREGKFHQVKRMLAARGKPVRALERIRVGNLRLDLSLSRGDYRFLTDEETAKLHTLL